VTRAVAALALAVAGLAALAGPTLGVEPATLAGRLLVAKPELADPRFRQTVVFLVRHDAQGAMGLVVNRPLGEASLASLLRHLGIESGEAGGSIRVHWGGPVEGRRGFVLHTRDYAAPGTLAVDERLSVTDRSEIFRALADGTGPARSLFVLGYAGWAPGQLERELERGDWSTATADLDVIFDANVAAKWERARGLEVIRL
jgi:putative transcriptional regulator